VGYVCHNKAKPRNLGLKGGFMEIGIVIGAALISLIGAYLVSLGISESEDVLSQVEAAERERIKMKKALGK
jgi:hypothetical protein